MHIFETTSIKKIAIQGEFVIYCHKIICLGYPGIRRILKGIQVTEYRKGNFMRKRVLSLFMAFVLSLSMMPMTALAEGTDIVTEQEEQDGGNITDVSDTGADTGDDISGGNAVVTALGDAAVPAVQDGEHMDHPICGATCTHEKDDGFEHENVAWTGVATLTNDMATGCYYLTDDVELTETWAPVSGTVLCLNGHSITMNADNKNIINVYDYKAFTLCDCRDNGTITHGTKDDGTKYTGPGVAVSFATFNLYGGNITGNTRTNEDIANGGGVYLEGGSTRFYMYGGKITNNSVSNKGAGVYMENGAFYMYDGTISGNTTEGEGGGVYVDEEVRFTMEGGSISSNRATGNAGQGGGVYVSAAGSFLMKGGNITDNIAADRGGGVHLEGNNSSSGGSTFTMTGGAITNNTVGANGEANAKGGGVYIGIYSTFNVSGNVWITGNRYGVTDNNIYQDSVNNIVVTGRLIGGAKSIGVTANKTPTVDRPLTLATAGEGYQLTDTDAACFASDGDTFYPAFVNGNVQLLATEPHVHFICGTTRGGTCSHTGEGHTEELVWVGISDIKQISRSGNYYLTQDISLDGDVAIPYYRVNLCLNGKKITGGALKISSGNSAALSDCTDGGKITGATSLDGSIYLGQSTTFYMYGGSITGNALGVYANGGTFNMYGGEITENNYQGTDGCAGGVRVDSSGAFYMSGNARISNNTASFTTQEDASGCYGAAGVYVNGGTFRLTDNAEVSGNTLTIDESISDSRNNYAGGIYVKDGNVIVDGNVKITGNEKDGAASNVCLPEGQTITVGGALADDAEIGVIPENPIGVGEETVIAVGTNDHMLTAADLNAFSSDISGYTKALQEDANSIIFQNGEHRHSVCGEENCSDGHDAVKWRAISRLSDITAGGYYYLKGDVLLESAWNCEYADVNLCLNGKKITSTSGSCAITVADGASLAITDCRKDGQIIQKSYTKADCAVCVRGALTLWDGTITGNAVGYGGVYVEGGSFTMEGGTITGNTNESSGCGGVYVEEGTFTMNGGRITGNAGHYGSVYVNGATGKEGTFIMNGGSITENMSDKSVGGVYIGFCGIFRMTDGSIAGNTGGGVFLDGGTFHMEGGDITGNENTGTEGSGAVHIAYHGTFHMTGGRIFGNNTTAAGDSYAGGVYVSPYCNSFTVSGAAQITDNWKNGELQDGVYGQGANGTASNVCLPGSAVITIGEGLTEGARIGVSKSLPTTAAGDVRIAAAATNDQLDYRKIFDLDGVTDPDYSVIRNGEGNLYIHRHEHSWIYTAKDTTITATCSDAATCPDNGNGGSVTIKAPAENTLIYDGMGKPATLEGGFTTGVTPYITYKTGDTVLGAGVWPVDAGTYTAGIALNNEYIEIAGEPAGVTYTIQKAALTADRFMFLRPDNLIYDGNAKTATVEAKFGSADMGTVTVKYYQGDAEVPQPVDAGDYTVRISVTEGKNYTACDLTADDWKFTIACDTTAPTVGIGGDWTYTGEQIRPTVVVMVGDTELLEDRDYTVEYGENKDAGLFVGSVTVKAKGNYAFENVKKNFTIDQAQQTLSFAEVTVNKTCIDKAFTNQLTHKGDGAVTYASNDTAVATVNENTGEVTIVGAGTATITATAAGTSNYKTGTASYRLTVEKVKVHIVEAVVADKVYDGGMKADVTKVSFADGNNTIIEGLSMGTDYTAVGAFLSTDAGTQDVDVLVELLGDFAEHYELDSKTCTSMAYIAAKIIYIADVAAENRSYRLDDTSVKITGLNFRDDAGNSVTLTEGTDYTVTGGMADANAGRNKDVTVKVELLTDNYDLYDNKAATTVTIDKAAAEITAASTQTLLKNDREVDISDWAIFDNTDADAALTYTLEGDPVGITLTGSRLKAANAAGTVKEFNLRVSAAATANFLAPEEKTIKVTVEEKADAGVQITGSPDSKTYGDADFTLTAAGTATAGGTWNWISSDPDVLEIVADGKTATPTIKVKKVGTAMLTVSYSSDTHYGSANVTITVAAKAVTADMIDDIPAREYTGEAIEPVPAVKDGENALTEGTDFTIRYSGNIDAGTATLIITGQGNYTGEARKTFTISPRSISSAAIVLDAESLEYNGGEQTVNIRSVTLDGKELSVADYVIENNSNKAVDAKDSIILTISGRGNYTGTAATTWKITKIDPKPADFVVTPGLTTDLIYNGEAQSVTVTTRAGIRGMGAITVKYNGSTEAPTNAGNYVITMDVSEGSNYRAATGITAGMLTIKKAVHTALKDIRAEYEYAVAGEQTVRLADLVTGAKSYAVGRITGNTETEILSGLEVSGDGVLKYTLTGKGTAGSTVTVPVTITSVNYEDVTVNVVITITKATPAGKPGFNVVHESGKTLAEAGLDLINSTLDPKEGKLEWIDSEGNVLPGDTKMEEGRKYIWRFTPADPNYGILTGEVELYAPYRIIDGAGSSWTQDTGGSIAIRGDGEFAKFRSVRVDGNLVDPSNYTVTEGSTIITLKAEYLKTLSEGSHTFELVWTDGSASTNFTVAANTSDDKNDDNDDDSSNNGSNNDTAGSNSASSNNTVPGQITSPKTGDASGIWITLFMVSIAGLAAMLVRRKANNE